MKRVWPLIALVLIQPYLWCAQLHPVNEFPEYAIYPGAIDEGGFPIASAKLCLNEPKHVCFTLPPDKNQSDETYYGIRSQSKRIKLDQGGSLVLFNANSSGGSGSSDRYALLECDQGGHLRNLLPKVVVSNQADVAVWNLPNTSPMPIFITADYLWEGMEGHYSAHHFEVKVYLYDAAALKYRMKISYRTQRKYPGIDNWDAQPEVIEKERGRILNELGSR